MSVTRILNFNFNLIEWENEIQTKHNHKSSEFFDIKFGNYFWHLNPGYLLKRIYLAYSRDYILCIYILYSLALAVGNKLKCLRLGADKGETETYRK